MVDRFSERWLLVGLALMTTASLYLLVQFGWIVSLFSFGCVGFAYGGFIAAYPAIITKLFGIMNSPKIYGRVFTAWGTAGLIAPWLAGYLFDWTGSYDGALLTAGSLGIVSAIFILLFFKIQK